MTYFGELFQNGILVADSDRIRTECPTELRNQVINLIKRFYNSPTYEFRLRQIYSKAPFETWNINSIHPELNARREMEKNTVLFHKASKSSRIQNGRIDNAN